ncbi:TetR/AcrR family transcriptional regulator [Lactiplantibacillus sp. WILCCON 0030]|uniref:TetR/AcrR family transcriptional regulator n=1 Tax=Lactiplantibacillus brownii TaxID=3069269 RepID=A0ABU1ABN2_9LACO|nr:TetR/AcrR family transcriptional regulator [Lactiplantibacillus brownii]MDQ7938344.1 TetR/AcrR family transcriptional regulator [Lactiplantibacillus brownii]
MDIRVRKTKQALTAALFERLATQPIDSITVTALCQTAKISRRTFYIHYEHVTDIFEDYQLRLAEQVANSLSGPHLDASTLIATFDHILMTNFSGFKYLCLNQQQHQLVDQLQQMLFETLYDTLPKSQKTPANQLVLTSLAAGVMQTYIYWFNHDQALTYALVTKTNQALIHANLTLLENN